MWVQGLESMILVGPFHLGTFWAVKPGRKRLGMTVRPPVNHGFLRTNLPASPGRQLSRSLRETGAGGEAGSGAGRRGAALAVGPARPLPAGRAGRCQRARGGAVVARGGFRLPGRRRRRHGLLLLQAQEAGAGRAAARSQPGAGGRRGEGAAVQLGPASQGTGRRGGRAECGFLSGCALAALASFSPRGSVSR